MTDNNATTPTGRLFYDGECAFCLGWVRRMERAMSRSGFTLATLQSRWELRQSVTPGENDRPVFTEMILELPDGRELGGADAAMEIARHIWWLWPLWFVSRMPGAMPLLRVGYRWIARNRRCLNNACDITNGGKP